MTTLQAPPRFVQIHTFHSHVAALINADETGAAKRIPFGNVMRIRISSQCLKRYWRNAFPRMGIYDAVGAQPAIRSRIAVDRSIMDAVKAVVDVPEETLTAVQDAFNIGLHGPKGTKRDDRPTILLGYNELQYLKQKAIDICTQHTADHKAAAEAVQNLFKKTKEGDNMAVMRGNTLLPAGLEGALFGRTMTSDDAANLDAAMHVHHAFTVHAEEVENDYFSTIDDLLEPGEHGAAFLGDRELTSGIYYGYVAIDVPTLVSHITGCHPDQWLEQDRTPTGLMINRLLRVIATVSPGAKRGSTAPYTRAEFMLVEIGDDQPVTYANAFRSPSHAQIDSANEHLINHMKNLDEMYGISTQRRYMSAQHIDVPLAERTNLDELGQWVQSAVSQQPE